MVKTGSLVASLLVGLLAQHGLASPESTHQLRGQGAAAAGSVATPEVPAVESSSSEEGKGTGHHHPGVFAACSCQHGSGQCDCSLTRVGEGHEEVMGGVNVEEAHKNLTNHLHSHTEAMQAMWKEHGLGAEGMQCSCLQGSASCQCVHENDDKTLDAKLKDATESTLSMWWVAHGHGGYHPHYGGCHGGRYGACGCGYVGCRCAHGAHYGCGYR